MISQNCLSTHLTGRLLTLCLGLSLFLVQIPIALAIESTETCSNQRIQHALDTFKNPWQKQTAVSAIIQCGLTAAPALIVVLQTEIDPGIREAAVIALGYIGGPTSTRALIATLQLDSAAIVRKTAADALGHLRTKSSVNLLLAKLKQPDEDIYVRQAVAEALGKIGDAAAINPLLDMLQDTRQPLDLRQAAVKALGQIGEPAANALEIALQDRDLQTQYWAVKTLVDINSAKSRNTLQANQTKVTQILEAAYKAEIIEFDRVPAVRVPQGSGNQLRKPIICKVAWIAQRWDRCH